MPETAWEKFRGEYHVTKLETGETYTMKISFDTLPIAHAPEYSFLHIIYENFDDSFDSLSSGFPNGTLIEDTRIKQFNAPFGVTDYDNQRWALSMHYYFITDSILNIPVNTLVNDTILFYFSKSNIAFYPTDSVPYYSCMCRHLAVKVE